MRRNLIFAILCIAVFDWRSLSRENCGHAYRSRKFVLTFLDARLLRAGFCGKFESSDGCTDWLLKAKDDASAITPPPSYNLSCPLQLRNSCGEIKRNRRNVSYSLTVKTDHDVLVYACTGVTRARTRYVCVFVCLCVEERERESEGGRERELFPIRYNDTRARARGGVRTGVYCRTIKSQAVRQTFNRLDRVRSARYISKRGAKGRKRAESRRNEGTIQRYDK